MTSAVECTGSQRSMVQQNRPTTIKELLCAQPTHAVYARTITCSIAHFPRVFLVTMATQYSQCACVRVCVSMWVGGWVYVWYNQRGMYHIISIPPRCKGGRSNGQLGTVLYSTVQYLYSMLPLLGTVQTLSTDFGWCPVLREGAVLNSECGIQR